MTDAFEKLWQQGQLEGWRADASNVVAWFARFNIDAADVYNHVVNNTDYDTAQAVCYLLSKLDNAVKLCDFLDTLERDNNKDVDVIKIYLLISHAEIASRSLGGRGNGQELVRAFFAPVAPELQYRIKPTLASGGMIPDQDAAFILYKIRCEYTHEGNYTGKIFQRDGEKAFGNLFSYHVDGSGLSGECGMTYREFLGICMRALIEHIKRFSRYPDAATVGERPDRADAFMADGCYASTRGIKCGQIPIAPPRVC